MTEDEKDQMERGNLTSCYCLLASTKPLIYKVKVVPSIAPIHEEDRLTDKDDTKERGGGWRRWCLFPEESEV